MKLWQGAIKGKRRKKGLTQALHGMGQGSHKNESNLEGPHMLDRICLARYDTYFIKYIYIYIYHAEEEIWNVTPDCLMPGSVIQRLYCVFSDNVQIGF